MSLQEHRRYTVKDLYETRTAFKWDLGWGIETRKLLLLVICHCTLQSHCKCAVKELYCDTLTLPMLQFEENKLSKLVPYKRCQFKRQWKRHDDIVGLRNNLCYLLLSWRRASESAIMSLHKKSDLVCSSYCPYVSSEEEWHANAET